MNLAEINGIKSPYSVKDGQTLRLPMEDSFGVPEKIMKKDELSNYHESPLEKKTEKDELDDEFAGVIATKGLKSSNVTRTPPSKTSGSTGSSFNEQEEILSSPKVTQTATGKTLKENSPASENTKKSPIVEKPKVTASNKMVYPAKGKIISRFGDVKDGISNDGINIKASVGIPVKAAAGGDVIYAGNKLEEFGNTVIVQHDNGLITSYAHLNNINVKNGAKINSGDIIGAVGKTGDVTEPQLHFEVLNNKTPVDPEKYLAR
jgi:murein DD-endopeptidase MepM/ murein hydrolase activator NlpD